MVDETGAAADGAGGGVGGTAVRYDGGAPTLGVGRGEVVAREAAALVLVSVVVGAKAASVAAALDDSALPRRPGAEGQGRRHLALEAQLRDPPQGAGVPDDAGVEEPGDDVLAGAGRPEGGDDLGLTFHGARPAGGLPPAERRLLANRERKGRRGRRSCVRMGSAQAFESTSGAEPTGPEETARMMQAVKERVTIQPGGRIELDVPGLPAGAEAEVIVMVEQVAAGDARAAVESSADAGRQPPDYREVLQVPDADEADRWSWEWTGPGEDLRAKVLPRGTDEEP
ncbi:MAG TPA: hypothetical protein VGG06_11475 [Thermoanaerobaculia bacterium]